MARNVVAGVVLAMWVGLPGCGLVVDQHEVLGPLVRSDGGQGGGAGGGAGGGSEDAGVVDAGACVPAGASEAWPVKVLVQVDNSGKLCVLDPPGSQGATGFCELAASLTGDAGPTPGRLQALERLWARAPADGGVSIAVTWWAPGQHSTPFLPAPGPFPSTVVDDLTRNLGRASDLEGGLDLLRSVLEADLTATPALTRARTKYVVVLVHTGVPFPFCAVDDGLPSYATPGNPVGVFADSAAAGGFCNAATTLPCNPTTGVDSAGNVCLPGFSAGGARNQPDTLVAKAAALHGLAAAYGVGAITVHTRQLFDAAPIVACGPICSDLFGGWSTTDAKGFGHFLLSALADAGQGTFVDPGTPRQLDLSDLDLTPLRPACH